MEAEHTSLGPSPYSKDFDKCMRQLEAMERTMEAQRDVGISTMPRQRLRGNTISPQIDVRNPREGVKMLNSDSGN